jgi:hypothetical protein
MYTSTRAPIRVLGDEQRCSVSRVPSEALPALARECAALAGARISSQGMKDESDKRLSDGKTPV